MSFPIHQIKSKSLKQYIFPRLNPENIPENFYYQGNLTLLKDQAPKIAIVGTRTPSLYAQKIIQHIIPDIASEGFTIVSGGAFGVDILSQKLALNFTNKLITVLGSGLNFWTPKTNISKFQDFLNSGGLLCSPFDPNIKPTKYTFVQRNQHIASMVDLVLIIEAGRKSGSLHTAKYASEQGIPVACFPSNIFQELSHGTNSLIQDGAHLVTCFQDIKSLMPLHRLEHLQKPSITKNLSSEQDIFSELNSIINNSLNLK